jgi:hypothetical protein
MAGADQPRPIFPAKVNRYQWGFDDPENGTGTDEKMVVGDGFEPSKALASRFTVCPRWPLG